MKLKNSTDFPSWFLRRMIGWICQHKAIGMSVRQIGEANFQNMHDSSGNFSGRAYCRNRGYYNNRFKVRISPLKDWENQGKRIRALVYVTAHEIEHLNQTLDVLKGRHREREARAWGYAVQEDFIAREAELTEAWFAPPVYATRSSAPKSVVDKRKEAAIKNLKTWQRKLKMAENKVAKWQKKVRYYEKKEGEANG